MGKRSQKKAKAEAANAECLESSIEDVEAKGISHLPEEILLKILHFSAFNKNLKSIYQSSDFFRSLIDGSTNLKNKLALSIHSNPTWTSEYLQEVSKANTDSERKFKIARLEVGTHLPILCYQDVNSVLQKQTLLTDLTINIKMMRDAKNLRTILFGLHNNKTLKRLNVKIKSTKKNIQSDFSGISCFPSLQELSIRGSHNPSYSLFFSCQAVRVLELEGLNKPEDFDRAISLVGKLKNTLKSLSFVDVTFDQFSFAKLISLTGLQLTSLKFNDVDIKAAVGHFPQFILSQTQLKNLDFHGIGLTTDTLNEIGKKLHTTEIQMLRIEVPKHTVFDNDEVEEENNWRLDNLKILILSGSCCIKTNLMHNIFCHRNDQLKVLRINAYADLKNGLLHKIVTNYNNLTELAFGSSCHFNNCDVRYIFKYLKELKHLEFSLDKAKGLTAGYFVRGGVHNTDLHDLSSVTLGLGDYVANSDLEAMALCMPNVHTVKILSTYKKFDDHTILTLVKGMPLLRKLEVPDLWDLNKHITVKTVDLIEEHNSGTRLRFHTETGKVYDMKVLRNALQDEKMDSN